MQRSTTYTELAHRAGDSVVVALLWRQVDNRLRVTVTDSRTGGELALDAHPENALDVFYHPFAYAAFRGLDYGVETARARTSAEALVA